MTNDITFLEFMKLSRKEQNARYKDLSNHDKFLARMSDVGADVDAEVSKPFTKEDVVKIAREHGIKEKNNTKKY